MNQYTTDDKIIIECSKRSREMANTVRYMKNTHDFPIRSVKMHKAHHVIVTMQDDYDDADVDDIIQYMVNVQMIHAAFIWGESAKTYRGIL